MHMYMYTRVVTAYRKWIKDIEELQTVKVNIPLVSDVDCTVLKKVSEWVSEWVTTLHYTPLHLSAAFTALHSATLYCADLSLLSYARCIVLLCVCVCVCVVRVRENVVSGERNCAALLGHIHHRPGQASADRHEVWSQHWYDFFWCVCECVSVCVHVCVCVCVCMWMCIYVCTCLCTRMNFMHCFFIVHYTTIPLYHYDTIWYHMIL